MRRSERTPGPDLGRGFMLLLIGLANAAGVVFGGPGVEPQPEGTERVLNAVMMTGVHARAYPVFALLFGYGLVQLAERQRAAGATAGEVRAILTRRHCWLAAFGLAHAALLYYGDFLGAYGVIGTIATLVLLGRGDRLVLWLWGLSGLHALVLAGMVAVELWSGAGGDAALPGSLVASLSAPGYAAGMAARLKEWPAHTLTVVPMIMIVWLGMWAARRRLLEDAAAHRRLLRRCAFAGLGIAFCGGLPAGLVSAGILRAGEDAVQGMFRLHQVSGVFGGPGYAALVALLAERAARGSRPRPVMEAVASLGRRSLSGYLLQSVAWLVLFAPYTLNLGDRSGSRLALALASASLVWLLSVAAGTWLERHGHRGPAEQLLRRLTYRSLSALQRRSPVS